MTEEISAFKKLLSTHLPLSTWCIACGDTDHEYGQGVKVSLSNSPNQAHAMVYPGSDKIVIRNHGFKSKYFYQIVTAVQASTDLGVEIL